MHASHMYICANGIVVPVHGFRPDWYSDTVLATPGSELPFLRSFNCKNITTTRFTYLGSPSIPA